jgi:23S rRNA pseudouridine2605 synthase
MRLARYLAAAGIGSRRSCEEMIRQGRITVDGEVVRTPATRVQPASSQVRCDGERLRLPRRWIYAALNKPSGYITTRSDERGRRTVEDLLGRLRGRVVPVGRLDRSSEGLLLFTNNGDLAQRLLHPRFRQPRTYLVWVAPVPANQVLRAIEGGVDIGGGERSGPARVRLLGAKGGTARVRIQLREGRNREIRRIFSAFGIRVTALRRISYAGVHLGDLPSGAVRALSPAEISLLGRRTGLDL